MRERGSWQQVGALASLAAALAGCGGSEKLAKAPSEAAPATGYAQPQQAAPPAPAPAAEPADRRSPSTPAPLSPAPAQAPPATTSPAEPLEAASIARAQRVERARVDLEHALRELDARPGACASACRALASMERAATHLCENASSVDEARMCEDAKRVVRAAHARVRSTCGVCP